MLQLIKAFVSFIKTKAGMGKKGGQKVSPIDWAKEKEEFKQRVLTGQSLYCGPLPDGF